MVGVSQLLELSSYSNCRKFAITIKLCSNVTCKTGINIILNTIFCNNLKKPINIFK